MKIIFMGTPDFAVPTFDSLVNSEHEVIAVYTQPDKKRDRGRAVHFTPVKQKAIEHNIPVYQPVRIREADSVEEIRRLNPDVIVVVAFGQIVSQEILDIPKYGCLNVHASLLPKYRGAAPIQWCIIDGEKETGVTIMQMDKGIDTGDMLKKTVVKIDDCETGGSLHDKLSVLGGDLILETLKDIEKNKIKPQKQDDSKSCYAKMLTKELGKIDWSDSAVRIERLVRGLNPWPSAYTLLDGKLCKIWMAKVVSNSVVKDKPGTIIELQKDAILIQTQEGILAVEELQLEGKKRMSVNDFLRGYKIKNMIVQ